MSRRICLFVYLVLQNIFLLGVSSNNVLSKEEFTDALRGFARNREQRHRDGRHRTWKTLPWKSPEKWTHDQVDELYRSLLRRSSKRGKTVRLNEGNAHFINSFLNNSSADADYSTTDEAGTHKAYQLLTGENTTFGELRKNKIESINNRTWWIHRVPKKSKMGASVLWGMNESGLFLPVLAFLQVLNANMRYKHDLKSAQKFDQENMPLQSIKKMKSAAVAGRVADGAAPLALLLASLRFPLCYKGKSVMLARLAAQIADIAHEKKSSKKMHLSDQDKSDWQDFVSSHPHLAKSLSREHVKGVGRRAHFSRIFYMLSALSQMLIFPFMRGSTHFYHKDLVHSEQKKYELRKNGDNSDSDDKGFYRKEVALQSGAEVLVTLTTVFDVLHKLFSIYHRKKTAQGVQSLLSAARAQQSN